MQNEYGEVLTEVFSDTLLRYAFMFGDEFPKDEISVDDADYLSITVGFSGERSGTLGISTSTDLCAVLTSNVLGNDPDDYESFDDSTSDALKELINVVCGQFLTAAFGEDPVIDMSPPAVSEIDEAEWKSLIDNKDTISFMIEDVPALVYVSAE